MKLLVTGAGGQVGYELLGALRPLGEVIALERVDLDLTDLDRVRKVILAVRPNVVVNAAAYTAVDRAENEDELAFRVNAAAPKVMAEALRESGGLLVQYSTDYVFDGAKHGPYVEDDPPNPLNAYGRSKLEGEQAVRTSGARYLILRTSWVYGARGHNFLLTMLSLFRKQPEVRVVDDQLGAPTWSGWIASTTARVLESCFAAGGFRLELAGTYHMSAAGSTSWYGFARAIRERMDTKAASRAPRVLAISTREYPLPAARPANSVLSNAKLQRAFGIEPRKWEEQLEDCLREMKSGGSTEPSISGQSPGADRA